MAYEIRMEGKPAETFESSEAALDRVREILASDPDADPEVIDSKTGRAFEPAASKRWREHLANKVGY